MHLPEGAQSIVIPGHMAVWGSEAGMAQRLRERASEDFGEVMAPPLLTGDDSTASMRWALSTVARAAQEPAGLSLVEHSARSVH